MNLACFATLFFIRLHYPVKYTFSSILSNNSADILAVSLVISYCKFSSLTWQLVTVISFYILSKKLFLKLERLFGQQVASVIWFCRTLFVKTYKSFKVKTWWKIKCYLLWNFYSCVNYSMDFSLIFLDRIKWNCVIKAREMCSFLPLINSSVTYGLPFYYLAYQQSFHQKTIYILRFLFGLYFSRFLLRPSISSTLE